MICNHTIFRDRVKNPNSSEVGADWSLRSRTELLIDV